MGHGSAELVTDLPPSTFAFVLRRALEGAVTAWVTGIVLALRLFLASLSLLEDSSADALPWPPTAAF